MIESFFKRRQALAQIVSTPAGPHLAGFTAELARDGFSYWVLRTRIQGAAHFSQWSGRRGISTEQLQEEMLGGFTRHLTGAGAQDLRESIDVAPRSEPKTVPSASSGCGSYVETSPFPEPYSLHTPRSSVHTGGAELPPGEGGPGTRAIVWRQR